jgi:endonuclease YncB( thermonuclease family)
VVSIALTDTGTSKFCRLTRAVARRGRALGKRQAFVIEINGHVKSRPQLDYDATPNGICGAHGFEIQGIPWRATYRIDHVSDGDIVVLNSGDRVRLVQIDTPEVYFGTDGPQASATTKQLLPEGTPVRLLPEPATDRVDDYGRLLRYVIRVRGGVNVNLRLVAVGAAAPYFYDGRRGRYAARLERLAKHARVAHLGLWGACPQTRIEASRRAAKPGYKSHATRHPGEARA